MSSDGEKNRQSKTKKRRYPGQAENDSSEEYADPLKKTRRNQSACISSEDKTIIRDKNEMEAAGSSCVHQDKTSNGQTINEASFGDPVNEQYSKTSQPPVSPENPVNDKDATRTQESCGMSASTNTESKDHCPICLTAFTNQEVGTPISCNHCFCLHCITEWANSRNTCPIDRSNFGTILVRERYGGEITHTKTIAAATRQQYSVIRSYLFQPLWSSYASDPGTWYPSQNNMALLSMAEDLFIEISENEGDYYLEEEDVSLSNDQVSTASQNSDVQNDDQNTQQQSSASSASDDGDLRISVSSHETDGTSPNVQSDCSIVGPSDSSYDHYDESDDISHHGEDQNSPLSLTASTEPDDAYYEMYADDQSSESSESSDSSSSSSASVIYAQYSPYSTDYSF